MTAFSRRAVLGGLALTAPAVALAQKRTYKITPEQVGDGVWLVRGADEPIADANGGAIANIVIIDTPAGTVLVDCGPSYAYAFALKQAAVALTGKPVIRVYITHLHPDHGMGIGAFDPAIVAALPATITDIRRDERGFSDALYRILGDWMRGTDLFVPGIAITMESEEFAGRRLKLLSLAGHSNGDLAILDEQSGLLIAGDLVFHNRAPSTPTADIAIWQQSLDTLSTLPHKGLIPGHGAFDSTGQAAIVQTKDWTGWVNATLTDAVSSGLDMVEAGNLPIPGRFASLAAARYELQRSVSHLYPALEARLLPRVDAPER